MKKVLMTMPNDYEVRGMTAGISIVNCAALNKKIGKLEYKAKYGKPHPHLPLRYSRFSDFGPP